MTDNFLLLKRTFISIFFIVNIFYTLTAQNIFIESNNIDSYLIAEELFKKCLYNEAIFYYEKSLQNPERKNNLELQYHLAECYRFNRLFEKAEKYYQIVADSKEKEFPTSLFWLGKMLKTEEKYIEAKKQFNEFLKNNNNDKIYLDEASQELSLCDSAEKIKGIPSFINIESLGSGINKEFSSDRAILRHDTLWFIGTIAQKSKDKVYLTNGKGKYKERYFTRLFYSYLLNSGNWKEAALIEIPLNDKKTNIGSPFFDPISDKLFLTLCKTENNKEHCDIYQSNFQDNKLSTPVKLDAPVNLDLTSSKDPMPVIIKNTEYLFFTSDRENGEGGFDIYYCIIDKSGKTGEVTNAGDKINTKFDEHSPFYDPDMGTLFFSSKGYNSVGEYDIFSIKGDPINGWGKIQNLGFPVNSGADDYYYYQVPLGNNNYRAYFSSNRPVKGDFLYGTRYDNIYQFTYSTAKSAPEIRMITLKCLSFDAETNEPLDETTFKLFQASTNKLSSEKNCGHSNTVSFLLNRDTSYSVLILKDDFDSVLLNIDIPDKDSVILQNVSLKKKLNPLPVIITKNTDIKSKYADVKIDRNQLVQPEDFKFPVIYYDVNNSLIRPFEKRKLDSLVVELQKRPELVIFIETFADNESAKKMNVEFFRECTENIIEYLVSQGVELPRLIGQWNAEEKPVGSITTNIDDSTRGKEFNVRTEFSIIKDLTTARKTRLGYSDDKVISNTSDKKKEFGTDMDIREFNNMLLKYGHIRKNKLYFRVQVGAYKNVDANIQAKINQFTYLQDKTEILLELETDGDYKKYVTGRFHTLSEVNAVKLKIRKTGIKAAFIVPYYNKKRISMSETETILSK